LQFKLKVTKNDFTCIQCADKERFKTRPDDTQCDYFIILTTVSKFGTQSSFNVAVTLYVIFAVN